MGRKEPIWLEEVREALHRAVVEFCRRTGDRHSDIAEELGISAGHFSNQLQGAAPLHLYTFFRAVLLTQDFRPVHVLVSRWGYFVAAPRDEGMGFAEIHNALAKCALEEGEAMAAVVDAIRDGVVTPAELRKMNKELNDVRAAIDTLQYKLNSAGETTNGTKAHEQGEM